MMSSSTYKSDASRVFSTGIADWVLDAGYALGIQLPPRVGGHDLQRNAPGGNQVGGGQGADSHGKGQASRWDDYKKKVEAAWKHKYGVNFDQSHVRNILGKGEQEKGEEEEETKHNSPKVAQRENPVEVEKRKQKALAEKAAAEKKEKEQMEEDIRRLCILIPGDLHWQSYIGGSTNSEMRHLVEKLGKQKNAGADLHHPVDAIHKVGSKIPEVKHALERAHR